MAQIHRAPPRTKSFMEGLLGGLSESLPSTINSLISDRNKESQQRHEMAKARLLADQQENIQNLKYQNQLDLQEKSQFNKMISENLSMEMAGLAPAGSTKEMMDKYNQLTQSLTSNPMELQEEVESQQPETEFEPDEDFIGPMQPGKTALKPRNKEILPQSTQPDIDYENTPYPESTIAQVRNKFPKVAADMRKHNEELSKKQSKETEKKEIQDRAQRSFDGLAEILRSGNVGRGSELIGTISPGEYGASKAKAVGEFKSLTAGLEAILVDMVSRGTLSNTRFKYITETLLPSATDRDATIEGKLKGLAKELDLDDSALNPKKQKSNKETTFKVRAPDGTIRNVPKSQLQSALDNRGVLIQ